MTGRKSGRIYGKKQQFSLFFAIFLGISGFLTAAESDNPVAVSFADVLAEPARDSDLRLAYGDEDLQFGKLWLANAERDQGGTIIFIHGGCWLNSFDLDHGAALATALSDSGYSVWSLEYRRTGDAGGGWPGSYEDVQKGINFLLEIEAPVNKDNIALAGHSAGGHLALLAGSQQEALAIELDLVIGLAAITDVVAYSAGSNSCETATPVFMNGTASEQPEAYDAASPANHGLHPQTVLLHGDQDDIVPLQQTELVNAQVIVSPRAGHFDWIHPRTPAFNRLQRLLAERLGD